MFIDSDGSNVSDIGRKGVFGRMSLEIAESISSAIIRQWTS